VSSWILLQISKYLGGKKTLDEEEKEKAEREKERLQNIRGAIKK